MAPAVRVVTRALLPAAKSFPACIFNAFGDLDQVRHRVNAEGKPHAVSSPLVEVARQGEVGVAAKANASKRCPRQRVH